MSAAPSSPSVHATAVVDDRATLGEGVEIGPYAVIEGPVVLGDGTRVRAHGMVCGHTELGRENEIFPGAVIGIAPQDLKHRGEATRLVVGDRNQFREHVTVHAGTIKGGGITRIGSDNLFMVGSHVAHDCAIGNRVVLSNHVLLAGHIRVGDRAILNGACACHHFTTIGRLAYVGGLTRITQDVHPFTIVEGHPARIRACNVIGMRRAGIEEDDVQLIKNAVRDILVSDRMSAADGIARYNESHPGHPLITELVASIEASRDGRQGRAGELPAKKT